jgi:HK97 family phage portal protein
VRSPLRTLAAAALAVRAKSPVPYAPRSSRISLPSQQFSGAEAQMRAMGAVGTLFAIVSRLATAVSQVDWRLYRAAPSGMAEDRQEVTRHAALDLWNKPNEFFTRQEFVETFSQHLDLTGEGWWLIARHARMRSVPLELWPVRPDRIAPNPDPVEFIRDYTYFGPDGQRVTLQRDEVIQLRMPNPLDIYRGMGPVQALLADLDATRYSAEWNRNFFVNSALPSGIIEAPENLSDDQFDTLRDRWEEQHRGVAAAHRVAILEGGLKWVDRRFTMADMQFTELRGMSRELIREAFGFPKSMLGTVDDVNRANAEAGEVMFARWLVVPRLERIKQALNAELLPMFGDTARGLEFDYCDPVPEDAEAADRERTSKAQAAKALVEAGYEPADVLGAVGLPEMGYVGTASVETPPPPGGAPAVPVAVRRPVLVAQAEPEESREDWQDRLDELIERWLDDVSPAQRQELAGQIEALVDAGEVGGLATLAVSSGAGAALLEAAMSAQAEAAGERMVEAAAAQGVAIAAAPVAGVLAADLAAAAGVTAALLAAGLAAAAGREALRVWAPGDSGAEVAGRVTEHLESLTDATLRTELGGAIWGAEGEGRFATLQRAEDDGRGPDWYEASEFRDRNACEPCREVDGKRFDSLATARAAYPYGGYVTCEGRYRCRGAVVPVWEGS